MSTLPSDWKIAKVGQLAKHLGVGQHKVGDWIDAGELAAVNVATTRDTRPIYRITREAFDAFWASRATSTPAPTAPPKRRRTSAVKSFV